MKTLKDRKQAKFATKYVSHFLSLKSLAELSPFVAKDSKNASKEITECFAIYYQILKMYKPSDNLSVIVVGDGCRPQLGVLLAFMSKWNIHSCDPNMKTTSLQVSHVKRLNIYKKRLEELEKINCNGEDVVIIFPHSHADIRQFALPLQNFYKCSIISMPCCVKIPQSMLKLKHEVVEDEILGFFTDKNIMYIWENIL